MYLAGVLDLHGSKLVGWVMDSRMKTELICAALKQVIGRTGASKGLIVHSEQGYNMLVSASDSSSKSMNLSAA
ncbi:DDE-type integrase/transposase/recombinase [Paenibacillus sp. FSL H7-0331]|uniref:DDE-type integrase/transposase/recombinase n=1 Tax=Paenibacillus sp. FSL H7-0331 TaxID=1920421 RepID=UPI0009701FC2|nr:hypothetical protein BK127_31470 [Paenibacillus sp. FSL H7-0331]